MGAGLALSNALNHEGAASSAPTFMIQEKIEKKINGSLSPVHLTIVDETWRHVGHTGAVPGKGHFILHVVSHQFEGIALLNRNRLVFDILKDEMGTEIHALTIRAQTPSEWERWSVKE